jgi:putative ABC transport system permease protein
MAAHGLVPKDASLTVSWVPLLPAAGACLLASLAGGLAAAHRSARIPPSRALSDSVAPQRSIGPIRTFLGVAALLGGGMLISVLMSAGPDAVEAAPLALLLFLVGVALLGPALARLLVTLLALPLRLMGVSGELAAQGGRARARRLASAITPIALMVAFACTKIGARTYTQESARDTWLDDCGLLLYAGFAAITAANTLVMVTLERRREVALLRLVGTTSRQVRRIVRWEALTVVLAGCGTGTAIATLVLIPISHALTGRSQPYLPLELYGAVATAALLLALSATGLPLWRLLRSRPIDTVR